MATNGGGPAAVEAIVFDFDGTLAEPRLDFSEMRRRLCVLAREYLPDVSGDSPLPVLEWLKLLMERVGERDRRGASAFQARAEVVILDMEMDAARNGRLFPFTRSVLEGLRMRRIKTAIITRNCTPAVRAVFPDLDSYCRCLLTRDHVDRVKPDPDHLFRALAMIASPPERAVVVGDHPLDIETGKRAGVRTAGVWSGKSTRDDLARSGADFLAGNCEELIEILKEQALI